VGKKSIDGVSGFDWDFQKITGELS
jgi:hypothetical protein